jgi:hypothetical protein
MLAAAATHPHPAPSAWPASARLVVGVGCGCVGVCVWGGYRSLGLACARLRGQPFARLRNQLLKAADMPGLSSVATHVSRQLGMGACDAHKRVGDVMMADKHTSCRQTSSPVLCACFLWFTKTDQINRILCIYQQDCSCSRPCLTWMSMDE